MGGDTDEVVYMNGMTDVDWQLLDSAGNPSTLGTIDKATGELTVGTAEGELTVVASYPDAGEARVGVTIKDPLLIIAPDSVEVPPLGKGYGELTITDCKLGHQYSAGDSSETCGNSREVTLNFKTSDRIEFATKSLHYNVYEDGSLISNETVQAKLVDGFSVVDAANYGFESGQGRMWIGQTNDYHQENSDDYASWTQKCILDHKDGPINNIFVGSELSNVTVVTQIKRYKHDAFSSNAMRFTYLLAGTEHTQTTARSDSVSLKGPIVQVCPL
ncbi:TPA: hypothetical protein ACVU5P_004957 [Vibrio parahaemolyticus]